MNRYSPLAVKRDWYTMVVQSVLTVSMVPAAMFRKNGARPMSRGRCRLRLLFAKESRLRICRAITVGRVETIEQQRADVCAKPLRAYREQLLSHKSVRHKILYTYTAYTGGACKRARGNAIKLSAKTIIYPDPAVPRNEGK